ncbi:hypothetical protein QP222_05730 [Corynebacterium pyruviciproducens]|uniref:hypothetical protein n=1 Tax=Corynebacterium pyruviciproducens TaxID=598660 RepID=UPI00254EA95B|nr:hypothetical protein [Corynebacterium pyruviciproducens]MDK6565909.1 hypothetical protein [Corynebacterium pyruviciproducens]
MNANPLLATIINNPQAVAVICAIIAVIAPVYQSRLSHRSSVQATVETSTKTLIESLERQVASLQDQLDHVRAELEEVRAGQELAYSYQRYVSGEFDRLREWLASLGLRWPKPDPLSWAEWLNSHRARGNDDSE